MKRMEKYKVELQFVSAYRDISASGAAVATPKMGGNLRTRVEEGATMIKMTIWRCSSQTLELGSKISILPKVRFRKLATSTGLLPNNARAPHSKIQPNSESRNFLTLITLL
jgi:hypothetical protein